MKERIEKLKAYEKWEVPTKMDFEAIVGSEVWAKHWQNWENVQELMREAQSLSEKINSEVALA